MKVRAMSLSFTRLNCHSWFSKRCAGVMSRFQQQYATLESQLGTMPPVFIAANRVLGCLSMTQGRLEQSMAHFEDALAFCRKADYRPELAWTSCDYADAMLKSDPPDDRSKAMPLLDESLAISSELGMRPLMERVLSRREILRA